MGDAMQNYFNSLTPREQDELQIIGMVWNNSHRPLDAHGIVKDCVEAGLTAEHFVRASHKKFWEWTVDAHEAGRPLDWEPITAGKSFPSEWFVEILDIKVNSPITESALYHARHIIALAQAETVSLRAMELARAAAKYDPSNPEEITALASQGWDDLLAVKAVSPGRVVMISESMQAAYGEIEAAQIAKDAGASVMISTGITGFDQKYGGLNRKGFHVLGARPGVGKTTVAINIALAAAKSGSRVLFFTHEMGHTELSKKIISHGGSISANRLHKGDVGTDDVPRLKRGIMAAIDLPIGIDDKSMPDWRMVEKRIRQHARSYKLSLVVIDYLQQLTCSGERWNSRVQELTHITGKIKSLSQELEIAVLGCAQLNREADKTGSGGTVPTLSMLKDCGSLEQDADIVMFIHRAEDEEDGYSELLVEKHRHDQAGLSFRLKTDLGFSRITSAGSGEKIIRKRKAKMDPTASVGGKWKSPGECAT